VAQVPGGGSHPDGLLQHLICDFSSRRVVGQGLFLVSVLFCLYFAVVYVR